VAEEVEGESGVGWGCDEGGFGGAECGVWVAGGEEVFGVDDLVEEGVLHGRLQGRGA